MLEAAMLEAEGSFVLIFLSDFCSNSILEDFKHDKRTT